jgi:hypothetical protein
MEMMAVESSTLAISDWCGRSRGTRRVNHVLNTEDFKDKDSGGYVWLIIAANPHLSASEIQKWLEKTDERYWRSVSWIKRHRWLFHGKRHTGGPSLNFDGLDERAFQIMQDNPKLSSRKLAHLLHANGVPRGAEWVRTHRVRPELPAAAHTITTITTATPSNPIQAPSAPALAGG